MSLPTSRLAYGRHADATRLSFAPSARSVTLMLIDANSCMTQIILHLIPTGVHFGAIPAP
jgi:hypothetical protein